MVNIHKLKMEKKKVTKGLQKERDKGRKLNLRKVDSLMIKRSKLSQEIKKRKSTKKRKQ